MTPLLALLSGCRRDEDAATLDVTVALVDAAGDPLGDGCREAVAGVAIAVDGAPAGGTDCAAGSVQVKGLVAGERVTVTATAFLASGPVVLEETMTPDPGKNPVRFEVPVEATERISVEPLFFPDGHRVEEVELDLSPTGAPCSDLRWTAEGVEVPNCARVSAIPALLEAVVAPGAWSWALRGYTRGELCWEAGGELDLDAGGADAPTALGTAFAVADFADRCSEPTATATVVSDALGCAEEGGRRAIDALTYEVFADGAGQCVDAALVRAGVEEATCEPLACAEDPAEITLPEGDYTVRITGTTGGVVCAAGEAEVSLDRDRTVQVTLDPANDPACTVPEPERLADSVGEFAGTQGSDGWRYGYYTVVGDPSSFVEYDTYRADGSWGNAASDWWAGVWDTHQHPELLLGEMQAVRRWTSEWDGQIRVTGQAWDRDVTCGDGQYPQIYVGSSRLVELHVTTTKPTPIDVVLPVTAGVNVDFALAYGINDACDDTGWEVVIESAPTAR